MRTHTRHVLMCTDSLCMPNGIKAEVMFKLLSEKTDARPGLRVKRTRTHCMAVCKNQGPLLVVYPEGVWYRCADDHALQRIVTGHLQDGREVSELVFHRLGVGDIYEAE